MKWFRNKSPEKQDMHGTYEQLIRLAVEDYRDRRYATSIDYFRDAANVQQLEDHHQILLDRAERRWKQAHEGIEAQDSVMPAMATANEG